MTTLTNTETLEQIAKRLPKALYNIVCFSCSEAFCKHWQEDASDAILSALRNERERAAKVGFDTVKALGDSVYEYSVTQKAAMVAAAIREGR